MARLEWTKGMQPITFHQLDEEQLHLCICNAIKLYHVGGRCLYSPNPFQPIDITHAGWFYSGRGGTRRDCEALRVYVASTIGGGAQSWPLEQLLKDMKKP